MPLDGRKHHLELCRTESGQDLGPATDLQEVSRTGKQNELHQGHAISNIQSVGNFSVRCFFFQKINYKGGGKITSRSNEVENICQILKNGQD